MGAPVKIVLVQQLSNFQRAPQGYLKELFDSRKSIAHIYHGVNSSCTPAAPFVGAGEYMVRFIMLAHFYTKALFQ